MAWYFDQYVYEQMLAFCEKYKVYPQDVIVVFAYNPLLENDYKERKFYQDHWTYCVITLEDIKKGVESRRYKLYGEGYGKIT